MAATGRFSAETLPKKTRPRRGLVPPKELPIFTARTLGPPEPTTRAGAGGCGRSPNRNRSGSDKASLLDVLNCPEVLLELGTAAEDPARQLLGATLRYLACYLETGRNGAWTLTDLESAASDDGSSQTSSEMYLSAINLLKFRDKASYDRLFELVASLEVRANLH